jgi:hypothetical protein
VDEQTWQACSEPQEMLEYLRPTGKLSGRKARLFKVACCRRIQHLLTREDVRSCQEAIAVQERYADGQATEADLRSAQSRVNAYATTAGALVAHPGEVDYYAVSYAAWAVNAAEAVVAARDAARAVAYDAVARLGHDTVAAIAASWRHDRRQGRARWAADQATVTTVPAYTAAHARERSVQADLLRCVFGNPFAAEPRIDPSWITWIGGTVKRLAEAVYEERAFERMPILADALLDSGCDDDQLIEHCRAGGEHARGCVVLDATLGKS